MRGDHTIDTLLFLVGPPGSGKSTLAAMLAAQIPSTTVLCAGNCWREIAAGNSRFAGAVKGAMERHEPIPNRVFMLTHKLFFRWHRAADRIVIDGTPYSVSQMKHVLEAYRAQKRSSPKALVAMLDVDDNECMKRMRARRRTDDTEATMRQRLALYNREQREVVEEAARRGLVADLIGLKATSDALGLIRSAMDS